MSAATLDSFARARDLLTEAISLIEGEPALKLTRKDLRAALDMIDAGLESVVLPTGADQATGDD